MITWYFCDPLRNKVLPGKKYHSDFLKHAKVCQGVGASFSYLRNLLLSNLFLKRPCLLNKISNIPISNKINLYF